MAKLCSICYSDPDDLSKCQAVRITVNALLNKDMGIPEIAKKTGLSSKNITRHKNLDHHQEHFILRLVDRDRNWTRRKTRQENLQAIRTDEEVDAMLAVLRKLKRNPNCDLCKGDQEIRWAYDKDYLKYGNAEHARTISKVSLTEKYLGYHKYGHLGMNLQVKAVEGIVRGILAGKKAPLEFIFHPTSTTISVLEGRKTAKKNKAKARKAREKAAALEAISAPEVPVSEPEVREVPEVGEVLKMDLSPAPVPHTPTPEQYVPFVNLQITKTRTEVWTFNGPETDAEVFSKKHQG